MPRTQFVVEKDLRPVAEGKPTTNAELAQLMLRALAEVAEKLDAIDEELDEILDGELEAAA